MTTHAGPLIDAGGPGISLSGVLPVNYPASFRSDLGAMASGKTLLLLEEPWVTVEFVPIAQAA